MTVQLLLAPAGAGKTAHVVAEARRHARGLSATPTVLVASALQAQSFRRRLARAGGAIGVRVLTFEELYELCLTPTGATYSQIHDPVRHRVIRSIVRQRSPVRGLSLAHYAPLVDQPGFVQVLRSMIDELKAARVRPASFAESVAAHGGSPRLRELADIYAAYQARLQAEGWADAAGMGWLAVEALEGGACPLGADWPLLLVDGFDDFTSVQLAVLECLSERVGRTVITLTGSVDGETRSLAHRRFDRTRQELVEILGVEPAPLPGDPGDCVDPDDCVDPHRAPVLIHVEAGLFRSDSSQVSGVGTVDLIEAANRAEEVRAALRWLKAEIVERGVSPGQLALLARDVEPYRPFVRQTGAEFGLPVHVYTGEPLEKNPAVAALIDLLRLMLLVGRDGAARVGEDGPGPEPGETEPALPPRLVIEAWRSPYFDWSAHDAIETGAAIGIEPGDAEALGVVARRGRVIAGLEQWEGAFEALAEVEASGGTGSNRANAVEQAEEGEVAPGTLTGPRVRDLHATFRRFVRRLTPPAGRCAARDFVRWLEDLIGPDPEASSDRFPRPEPPTSLGVIARIRAARIRAADHAMADRDLAALRCLKRILRGLVWAEEALDDPPITFPEFLAELTGAAEAAFYRLPRRTDEDEILVADAVAARGVPFRAVAVLGLAEGFFPAPQSEDPLLWDADREALELPLEPSTRSAEAEYFYETIAAPAERMLLTRPRLADDGAPWEPSPFWEEVRRLVDVEPTRPSSTSGPPLHQAASWPELLLSMGALARGGLPRATHLGATAVETLGTWLRECAPDAVEALDAAAQVLTWRQNRAESPFDGSLVGLRDHFTDHFDADHVWSASRLEAYRTCPFHFFVGQVLGLEPREEPTEGIDWLERGLIYHEILERVYGAVADPTDLEQLLGALPRVADAVLDRAPEGYGFRRTAWWAQTRSEIVDHVRRSLEALSEEALRGDFVPMRYEAAFGLGGEPPLVVRDPAARDGFRLRGLIDRVDRDGAGCVRIIDYKTGGPSSYGNPAIRDGEKLQLPLYALAARDALGLGQPRSGFYWHVRHAEPSPFTLEDFGPEEAIRTAVAYAWEAIRGAREGRFTPQPPKKGCPSYCPAVGFCWRYERGYWG